jgi:hypothetical protein
MVAILIQHLSKLHVSSDTTLKFSLTVKDDKGAASNNPAIVSVTVKAVAAPPTPPIAPPVANQTKSGGNATSMTTAASNQTKISSMIFITKWGSNGTADGQFNVPSGIAVDSSRNVYVADTLSNRIQVFAPSTNTSK